jgi:AcrR family transcriptional regulator
MTTFTELVADRGLAAVSVTDVVAHAGVSRSAFYACFDDLAGCADAAYERFISVLLTRLAQAMDPTDHWQVFVESPVRAYLETLQSDPVVARAMQIEMDARQARARPPSPSAETDRRRHRCQARGATPGRPLDRTAPRRSLPRDGLRRAPACLRCARRRHRAGPARARRADAPMDRCCRTRRRKRGHLDVPLDALAARPSDPSHQHANRERGFASTSSIFS